MFTRTLRSATLVLVAAAYATSATAQTEVAITPDVVYGHKDGMALTFDVFQPTQDANGAGVLFMVSGGWFSSWTPPEQAVNNYRFLLDEGFTVFAVRHGSAPRYVVPEAFSDVKRATRYVNLNAAELGVDPNRLGVWGGSAGGHLSLMLGFTADDGGNENGGGSDPVAAAPSRIAAVAAYFPPTDLRAMTGPNERFPALDFDRELSDAISPVLHVEPDAPPVLLIHGDEDTLVPLSHSSNLMSVLEGEGVHSELIVIEGAGHGFAGEDGVRAREAVLGWFVEHLLD